MNKNNLLFGSFGNGYTVFDKSVVVSGDYKKLAYIGNSGDITWFVEPCMIPGSSLLRIEHFADGVAAYNNNKNNIKKGSVLQ